ncbi:restriction endonuclease subunit S [Methanobrevibacter smithii]|uniref:restriction endonuclease subunit S n=1 Tax=Methanobrevibacter smithii TaxID=2173 RepID=UPI0037DD6828
MRFSGFDDEWKSFKLSEISKRITRKNKSLETDRPLTISAQYGLVDQIEYFNKIVASKSLKGYYLLNKGEFAYNKSYSNGYPFGAVKRLDDYENGAISTLYICFNTNDKMNSDLLKEYFETDKWHEEIYKIAVEGARNHGLLNVAVGDFFNTKHVLPTNNHEQEKIAKFLIEINTKIDLLENKHKAYQDFKKYLMQKIFAQELRFNFNDTWKTVKIKDIFDERSEKGFLDLELLSVTLNDGVIKRSEIESKDNSNENKFNYKHVLPGDIVYNSMRMWQGASGVSPYEGIVSPAYTILIPKNVYSKYFGYYFKTNEMVYQFKKYSQGLTSDTWNLKYPLISEIKIKIPSIEEQKEITNVFEIMDEKIKILQNNIDELTTFKKGLLQQMFVVQLILSLLQNKKHI